MGSRPKRTQVPKLVRKVDDMSHISANINSWGLLVKDFRFFQTEFDDPNLDAQ